MRSALRPVLSLLVLAGGVEARPSSYNCDGYSGWSDGASFSRMSVNGMKEDLSRCSISGLPQEYNPSTNYEITVKTAPGGALAYKLVVSTGSLSAGGTSQTNTCRNKNQKAQQQKFTWVSPKAGSGTVTMKALCGDYSNILSEKEAVRYPVPQPILALTLALAQLRILDLTLAQAQLRTLDLTLALAQLRILDLTLALAQLRILDLTLALAQLRILDLTLALAQLRILGLTLALAQLRTLDLTLALAQLRILDLTLALTLAKVQLRTLVLTLAQAQLRTLDLTLALAQLRILDLTLALAQLRILDLTLALAQLRILDLTLALTLAKVQLRTLVLTLAQAQLRTLALTLALTLAKVQLRTLALAQLHTLAKVQLRTLVLTLAQAQLRTLALTLALTLAKVQLRTLALAQLHTLAKVQLRTLVLTLAQAQLRTLALTLALTLAKVQLRTLALAQLHTLAKVQLRTLVLTLALAQLHTLAKVQLRTLVLTLALAQLHTLDQVLLPSQPTERPTKWYEKTKRPSAFPTLEPTSPTAATPYPSAYPTRFPTAEPTPYAIGVPTPQPTKFPTRFPTDPPTRFPTRARKTRRPSDQPTAYPTPDPTAQPNTAPTQPTPNPTRYPTRRPTLAPSLAAKNTNQPTRMPTTLSCKLPRYFGYGIKTIDCTAGGTLANHDQCAIECEDGYKPESTAAENLFKCERGRLSRPNFKCKPADCTLPTTFGDNIVSAGGTSGCTAGQTLAGGGYCRVACASGFVPTGGFPHYACKGELYEPTLTCQAAQATQPETCTLPDVLNPGIALNVNDESACAGGKILQAGQSCSVSCMKGWYPRNKGMTSTFSCSQNGELNTASLSCLSCGIDEPAVSVKIYGRENRTVYNTFDLKIGAMAKIKACRPSARRFTWTQTSGPEVYLEGMNRKYLKIPKGTLTPDSTYCFQLSFSVSAQQAGIGQWTGTATDSTCITVIGRAVVARIRGGKRKVAVDKSFKLDGSLSYDPEKAKENWKELQYIWRCDPADGTGECFTGTAAPVDMTRSVLKVPANALTGGSEYKFTLTVISDVRSRSKAARVYVKVSSSPVIAVDAEIRSNTIELDGGDVMRVSPSKPIKVMARFEREDLPFLPNYRFFWNCSDISLPTKLLSRPGLVIPARALLAGSTTTCKVQVTDSARNRAGESSVTIQVNSPPEGGSCEATVNNGTSLDIDHFSFSCSDWSDPDSGDAPLWYRYVLMKLDTDGTTLVEDVALSRWVEQSTFTASSIPAGDASSYYRKNVSQREFGEGWVG
eukprot:jgi/Bigna1/128201/aug1.6_g2909